MWIAIRVDLAVLGSPHARLRLGGTALALLAFSEVADLDGLSPMPAEAIARAYGLCTARPQQSVPPEG